MQVLKQSYIDIAQATGRAPFIKSMAQNARSAPIESWKRWAASLFAIYDTEAMVELDCPWWNVETTIAVEQFLASRTKPTVFEYGAGASTVWLARRAHKIISIEHDETWNQRFTSMIAGVSGIDLRLRPLGEAGAVSPYVSAIDESSDSYDMIVVDGRLRADCLAHAIPHLKPGGIILFDDSGRARYRAAIEGCGLQEDHQFGRSFCVPYPDHSSILSVG